jgi:biopolymer transport protein ExbD
MANGQPVASDAALRDHTRQALRQNPELRTVIAASAGASHGSVMHVVDTVRDAGAVKIAFAAAKIGGSASK